MNDAERSNTPKSRSQKERIGRIVFWIIILSFLTIGTICLVNAVKWVNKHFSGFLINERMVVAPIGQYYWTGSKAGLKYPDKILTADGKAVSSKSELEAVIDQKRVGDSIKYTVERGGKVFEVTIATMRFTAVDLIMTFGATFFAAIAFMLIGTAAFIMKPNIKVTWAFLMACFSISLWTITIFDIQSTHFGFIRLYLFATAIYPSAWVHFSWYFPEPRKFVSKRPWFYLIPYMVGLGIGIPMVILYPQKGFRIFYSLTQVYMILGAASVLYPVIYSLIRPVSVLARQRAKVVLFGAAVAFPTTAIIYFFQLIMGSFFGIRIQTNFLMLPLVVFPAAIGYSIARHNLFDVDVYIKRAVGYAIMTTIVVGAYLGVSIPLNILLGKYQIAQSRAFPILFTLAVILVFNPLYSRVQAVVDRVFFRKEYNYGEIVDKVGNAITSMLDLPAILKELVTTFTKDLFIDTSSVMLLTPEGAQFKVFMADGDQRQEVENVNIDRKAPVVEIIEQEKAELTKYDVLEDPKYQEVSQGCATDFEALNASLMVPLIYQEKVIGLLNLGEKKSGKFYTREDVNLIKTLASQGAVAIENARMVEEVIEKERMEEELSIARDLQVSMLPAECPQIKGFEIAAFSVSAREVGGDFYDFIEMGEEKAGFVIGDVTGKSVSGALVMSASRSVFRMLSESELTVAESMIRANRRLKKDVKTGMFVALLYAVMNSQDNTLTMCSAGQTQPVHLSVKSGEAALVETEGDTFPLGILDDANYEETHLRLEAGDKVIFYTDGIVEAMNAQEEMFGFERLLEIVQTSKSANAEELLQEIVDRVKEFTGDAPQHDDITVIAIRATG